MIPAVAPTCSKTGLTEGSRCSVCKEILKAQKNVAATGKHTWDKGKVTKTPTALSTGTKTYTCTVCKKATKNETLKKLTPTIKLYSGKKIIKEKKIKAKQYFTLTISKLAKGDSVKSVKSGKKGIVKIKKIKKNNYRITGLKKGKTIVTVTLKSGKTATCVVTVK